MTLKSVDRLNYIQRTITAEELTKVGYPVFVDNTPIRTGNARRKTVKLSTEIDANYPYAKRLDQGYSRQKPNGMVKPTIQAVRDYVRKKLG